MKRQSLNSNNGLQYCHSNIVNSDNVIRIIGEDSLYSIGGPHEGRGLTINGSVLEWTTKTINYAHIAVLLVKGQRPLSLGHRSIVGPLANNISNRLLS